jgi:hypothetical protein
MSTFEESWPECEICGGPVDPQVCIRFYMADEEYILHWECVGALESVFPNNNGKN